MKTYTATLDITVSVTTEDLKEYDVADPENPTDEEIVDVLQEIIQNYASSNSGSELLANAAFTVSTHEE